MLQSGDEWVVVSRDGTHLILIKGKDGKHRTPTEVEVQRAVSYLNEQNSYSVTLYCRNEKCKDKGSWIRRGIDDAKKNAYTCEVCHGLMVR